MTEKSLEARARRAARRADLLARKSRWRRDTVDNYGGFMLLDPYTNCVVYGARFELSPQEVIEIVRNGRRRDPMSEQVPTTSVTVQWVMRSAAFAAGVDDVRNGRPPDFDNQGEGDWNYERGRQWASLAPRSMPLKIGGTLNPKAIALYNAARKRGYVR